MIATFLDLVGNTPVIKLSRVNDTGSSILARLETLNPSGSIKDIMARYMMETARQQGKLRPGDRIIEATSGNTGIAFAMLAPLMECRFTAVMPEYMSQERRQMMRAFGAEIVLTPEKEGFAGTLKKAEELARANGGAWLPRQFDNPDNTAAHREITARNILAQVDERIDVVVAGIGTGGTLMGLAEGLRQAHPGLRVVAVEPAESAVMSGGSPGTHLIQGIGPGFIPGLVNMALIDEVISVKTADAVSMTRRLMREEGLMVGISSGANVLASLEIARRSGGNLTIVTVLADRGERYLSLDLF